MVELIYLAHDIVFFYYIGHCSKPPSQKVNYISPFSSSPSIFTQILNPNPSPPSISIPKSGNFLFFYAL